MSDLPNIFVPLIIVVGVTGSSILMGCRLNIKENALWKNSAIFIGLISYGIGGIVSAYIMLTSFNKNSTTGSIGAIMFFIGCIIISIWNFKVYKKSRGHS